MVICVATYRRPIQLSRTLASLEQSITVAEDVLPPVGLVVVDNDAGGTAAEVAAGFPRVQYRVEERPGIAHARNAALALAEHASHVAFVDDDEVVEPDWLRELWETMLTTGAEVVFGPVVSELPTSCDRRDLLPLLQRTYPARGWTKQLPATNNVLIDRRLLNAVNDEVFRPQFGLSGGSDADLFMRLQHLGYRFWFCPAAVVREEVPPDRATVGWITRRAYRTALGYTKLCLEHSPGVRTRGLRLARAVASLVKGGPLLLVGVVTGKLRWRAAGLVALARGAGGLAAQVGLDYQEYRRERLTLP